MFLAPRWLSSKPRSGSLPGSLENLTIAIFFKKRMAVSQNDPLVSIANGYTDGIDSLRNLLRSGLSVNSQLTTCTFPKDVISRDKLPSKSSQQSKYIYIYIYIYNKNIIGSLPVISNARKHFRRSSTKKSSKAHGSVYANFLITVIM